MFDFDLGLFVYLDETESYENNNNENRSTEQKSPAGEDDSHNIKNED